MWWFPCLAVVLGALGAHGAERVVGVSAGAPGSAPFSNATLCLVLDAARRVTVVSMTVEALDRLAPLGVLWPGGSDSVAGGTALAFDPPLIVSPGAHARVCVAGARGLRFAATVPGSAVAAIAGVLSVRCSSEADACAVPIAALTVDFQTLAGRGASTSSSSDAGAPSQSLGVGWIVAICLGGVFFVSVFVYVLYRRESRHHALDVNPGKPNGMRVVPLTLRNKAPATPPPRVAVKPAGAPVRVPIASKPAAPARPPIVIKPTMSAKR